MAQCPVCKRDGIFGEQVVYLNIVSDNFYFDCPGCGAFRMTGATRSVVAGMDEDAAHSLLVWIVGQNAAGEVPLVRESFALKLSRSSREKKLQEQEQEQEQEQLTH